MRTPQRSVMNRLTTERFWAQGWFQPVSNTLANQLINFFSIFPNWMDNSDSLLNATTHSLKEPPNERVLLTQMQPTPILSLHH